MFSFTEIDFGTIGEVQKVNMARLGTVYPDRIITSNWFGWFD